MSQEEIGSRVGGAYFPELKVLSILKSEEFQDWYRDVSYLGGLDGEDPQWPEERILGKIKELFRVD